MKHVFRFLGHKSNGSWQLHDADLYHLQKVVQLPVGDVFEVGDGAGSVATAVVRHLSKKEFLFEILEEKFHEPETKAVDLYLAALKPGVLDEVLPAVVELNAHAIYIFAQDKSELKKINEKVIARWQRIIEEATKQSKRPYLAQVKVHPSLRDALQEGTTLVDYASCWVLDETGTQTGVMRSEGRSAILVGSERGLTEETRQVASDNGFIPLRIARPILRAKTAVVAGLALIEYMHL